MVKFVADSDGIARVELGSKSAVDKRDWRKQITSHEQIHWNHE